jgi:RHH-type transcriptional regulator, rel operon repressor / antitoxin RelB
MGHQHRSFVMVAVRLPPDIEKRLERLAARTGRTKSEHIREAILRHLEDLEDAALAASRLEHPERRWTLEELERELDLDRRVG